MSIGRANNLRWASASGLWIILHLVFRQPMLVRNMFGPTKKLRDCSMFVSQCFQPASGSCYLFVSLSFSPPSPHQISASRLPELALPKLFRTFQALGAPASRNLKMCWCQARRKKPRATRRGQPKAHCALRGAWRSALVARLVWQVLNLGAKRGQKFFNRRFKTGIRVFEAGGCWRWHPTGGCSLTKREERGLVGAFHVRCELLNSILGSGGFRTIQSQKA